MGYPTELFADPVSKEFLCPICHDVLQDVVMLSPCDHTFCRECIGEWGNRNETCPVDMQRPLGLKIPQRPFLNMLNHLQLQCPFKDFGCNVTVLLENARNGQTEHSRDCKFNPENFVTCTGGCGEMIQRAVVVQHNCTAYLLQLLRAKDYELEQYRARVRELERAAGDNQPSSSAAVALPPTLPVVAQNGLSQPMTQPTGGTLWTGHLLWYKITIGHMTVNRIDCSIFSKAEGVNGLGWPCRLMLRLVPKVIVFSEVHLTDSKQVVFNFPQNSMTASLAQTMELGFVGVVTSSGTGAPGSATPPPHPPQAHQTPPQIAIILHYLPTRSNKFLGIIPNDPRGFADRIRSSWQQRQRAASGQAAAGAESPA